MLEVLYEDNHLIIVNKKTSDIIQGDKTGDTPLSEKIKEYLKDKYKKPGNVFTGVVHRLDRPVSGAVIFAKTSKALSRLNKMFEEKEVKKIYWAVVNNRPPKPQATIVHHLIRNQAKNKSKAYDHPLKGSKEASLSYRLLSSSDHYHLLEIELHTGRHHQIRSQLARIGCYIKGDLKYGFPRSNPNAGIHLHAREIEFIHPVSKKEIKVIAPLPNKDNLWKYFEENM